MSGGGHPEPSPFGAFDGPPRVYLEALAGMLDPNAAWVPNRAARVAGISHSQPVYWRTSRPGFAELEKQAMLMGAERLREFAVVRAVEGTESHRFTKDGDTIYHPTRCRCGHEDDDHLGMGDPATKAGDAVPCTAPGCSCETFRRAPYVDKLLSERLLERLLAAGMPKEFAERKSVEVSGVWARVDVRAMPHELIDQLADGAGLEELVVQLLAKGQAVPLLTPAKGEIVVDAPAPPAVGGGEAGKAGG